MSPILLCDHCARPAEHQRETLLSCDVCAPGGCETCMVWGREACRLHTANPPKYAPLALVPNAR